MKTFLLFSLLITSAQAFSKTTCFEQGNPDGGYQLSYSNSGIDKRGDEADLKLGSSEDKPVFYEVIYSSKFDDRTERSIRILNRIVSANTKRFPKQLELYRDKGQGNSWEVTIGKRTIILECEK